MGNASGREEDAATAGEDDVEDGGGDSSARSSERGFPPYGGGGNHVRRACSVGVVGASGGAGSPPGSPGRSLSPRMFVPQVRSRDPASSSPVRGSVYCSRVWFGCVVFRRCDLVMRRFE